MSPKFVRVEVQNRPEDVATFGRSRSVRIPREVVERAQETKAEPSKAPEAQAPSVAPDVGRAEGAPRGAVEGVAGVTDAKGSPTPRDPSLSERTVAALDRIADKARARRTQRQLPRAGPGSRTGATTLLDDSFDLALELAARAAAKGIRGGAKLKAFVAAGLREHGGRKVLAQRSAIVGEVRRVLAESRGSDGTIDGDLFERAAQASEIRQMRKTLSKRAKELRTEEARKDASTRKEAIAEKRREFEEARNLVREKAAEYRMYKRQLTGEAKAANAGYKQGAKDAKAAFVEKMKERDGEWKQRLETAKNKMAVMRGIRKEVVRMAAETLPVSERGRVNTLIADAKSYADLAEASRRIASVLRVYQARQARKSLLKTVGRAPKDKTEIKEPTELGTMKGIQPKEPKYLSAAKSINGKKLLPKYKDAVAPVAASIQESGKVEGVRTLADFLQNEADEGRSNFFGDRKLAALRDLEGRNGPTLDDAENDLIEQAIRHTARLSEIEHEAVVLGTNRDIREDAQVVRDDIVRRNKASKQGIISKAMGEAERGPHKGWLGRLVTWDRRDLSRMLSSVAGKESPLHTYGYVALADADSAASLLEWEGLHDLDAIAKAHKVDTADIGAEGKKARTYELPDAGTVTLTPAEATHAYALWTDPENRPNLIRQGIISKRFPGQQNRVMRLSADDFEALGGQLTDFQHDYIDTFKAFTNGRLRERINAMSREIWGFDIANNPDYVSRKLDRLLRKGLLENEDTSEVGWGEDAGIFQDRSVSTAPIVVDNFYAAAREHIGSASRYAETSVPIRNMRKLLSDPKLQATISERVGQQWVETVLDRLKEVGGRKGRLDVDGVGGGARAIQKATSVLALWGRLSSALGNLGGFPIAMVQMSPSEMARLTVRIFNLNRVSKGIEALSKERGYFAARWARGGEEVTAGVNIPRSAPSNKIGSFARGAIEAGFMPLEWADKWVASEIYWAVRADMKAKNGDWSDSRLDEEAARRAEFIVRQSQNPTSALDRTGIALSGSRNALVGMYAMFSGGPLKIGNLIEEAALDIRYAEDGKAKAKAAGRLVGTVFAGLLSAAAYEFIREIMRRQKQGFNAEEYPRSMVDHGLNVASDMLGTFLPGAGDAAKSVVQKLRGRPTFGSDNLVVDALSDLADAVKVLADSELEPDAKQWKVIERGVRALVPNAPVDFLQGIYRTFEAPANMATLDAAIKSGDTEEVARIRREIKKAEPKTDIQRRLKAYRKKNTEAAE